MPGQKVNTKHSKGLTVAETWAKLFHDNEMAWSKGKKRQIKTDEEITKAMLKAFPDRFESQIFSNGIPQALH